MALEENTALRVEASGREMPGDREPICRVPAREVKPGSREGCDAFVWGQAMRGRCWELVRGRGRWRLS